VLTRRLVCTDIIEIGENTVLRARVSCYGYKAEGGRIRMGCTTIGHNVIVGEGSLLDIGTRLEDGAQLAHASALYEARSYRPVGAITAQALRRRRMAGTLWNRGGAARSVGCRSA
jgi:hypothetical protein